MGVSLIPGAADSVILDKRESRTLGEVMEQVVRIVGDIAAVVGLLLCLISGVARLMNQWVQFGFETQTLFLVGVGLMVAGCLAKLHILGRRL